MGFSPLEIDLGSQPWYAEVPFNATFVNDGPEAVVVATVKSSCGCTVLERASYSDVVVEPAGALAISGTLDVGQLPGQHRKKLDLLLISGAIHPVFLKYAVFATYDFKPRNLRFGEVDLDDPTDDAITSVIFSSDTASIMGEAVVDSPWLEVGLHDRGNGEAEIAVHVVKRNLPYGRNFGRVSVSTDDSMRPSFTIPVYARGLSSLRPVPSHLFLRPGEQGCVRFITSDGATARIASAESDSTTVELVVDTDRRRIRVSLAGERLANAAVVSVTDDQGRGSKFLVSCVR